MDRKTSTSSPTVRIADDHTIIEPMVSLRGKAAVKIAASDQTDRDRLDRAERAVVALSRYFPSWMDDELSKLYKAARHYLEAEAKGRGDAHKDLTRTAYDMRGNAYQFGYPSAARVAELLCAMLDDPRIDAVPEVILKGHLDAIRSILRYGPGQDPTALEIVIVLEKLVETRQLDMVKAQSLSKA